jgi:hypothetical protein
MSRLDWSAVGGFAGRVIFGLGLVVMGVGRYYGEPIVGVQPYSPEMWHQRDVGSTIIETGGVLAVVGVTVIYLAKKMRPR